MERKRLERDRELRERKRHRYFKADGSEDEREASSPGTEAWLEARKLK